MQNSFKQIPAGRFDQESNTSFKWLSSNQLGNSRGINMRLRETEREAVRF
jgi:hypothetical protein